MTTWHKRDWEQFYELARRPWRRHSPPRRVSACLSLTTQAWTSTSRSVLVCQWTPGASGLTDRTLLFCAISSDLRDSRCKPRLIRSESLHHSKLFALIATTSTVFTSASSTEIFCPRFSKALRKSGSSHAPSSTSSQQKVL